MLKIIPDATPLVRKKCGLKNEIICDFSSEALGNILKDAEVIIHLAGSRDFLDPEKCRIGNVVLTKNICDAAPKAKIIFASSISVYGKKMAKIPANENTELRPDTPYAKTKIEAEKIVEKCKNYVILRIGPVYGKDFEEYFKVLLSIKNGKMTILGKGDNRIPFVNVEDVAQVIKNSTEKGHGTYVVVGKCHTQREIYTISAKELEVEAPKKQTSVLAANILAHYMLFKSKIFRRKPKIIPEEIAVLASNRDFDCTKAKKELGFEPRPLEKGITEMVEEFKRTYKS